MPDRPASTDLAAAHRALLGYLHACFPSAPREALEDAAQDAWLLWLVHRYGLRPAWQGWLNVVARRQALRLLLREERIHATLAAPAAAGDLDAEVEARARLAALERLSIAQRRVLLGRALGLSNAEIEATTGMTARAVRRHITRGRAALHALVSDGPLTGAPRSGQRRPPTR